MKSPELRPVLVTGCHRGGTTWVGDTIAAHDRLQYIQEPLNKGWPVSGRSIFQPQVPYHFQEIGTENKILEKQYSITLKNKIDFQNYLAIRMRHARGSVIENSKQLLSATRDFGRELRATKGKVACIKDPFSLLHCAWLATKFPEARIVVMVRHPAAFAFSLRKKDWNFPFETLLAQRDLMIKFKELEPEIERFLRHRHDIFEQASLLWGLLYSYVADLPNLENVLIVRYEDVAENPETEFGNIFSWLQLDVTEKINEKITMDTSGSGHRTESRVASRDSRSNAWAWKKHITTEEQSLVMKHCREPYEQFYS